MEAVQIKELKNGTFKVIFGTPRGSFRTVGKFDNKAEAEKLKAEIIANILKNSR